MFAWPGHVSITMTADVCPPFSSILVTETPLVRPSGIATDTAHSQVDAKINQRDIHVYVQGNEHINSRKDRFEASAQP